MMTPPTTHTTSPPQLVAKIYDPVFFDNDKTEWDDPFVLRDLAVSREVEAYQRLKPLQGTKVPRFYGYFAAAVAARTGVAVYTNFPEAAPGQDRAARVPSGYTEDAVAH